MAYRAPAFMVTNVVSSLALSAVTARNAGTFSDASKRALIDMRQTPIGSFAATGANAGVEFDLGTTLISSLVNRAVIPAGHNLTGETVRIVSGTTAGIGTPTVLATAVAGSGVIDLGWTPVAGHRYMALDISTSAAEVFTLGEFWLGFRFDLTADAWVQPPWRAEYQHELTEERFGARLATVETAPPRRRFSLEVLNLEPSGVDFLQLEGVVRGGRTAPLWFWPPDDSLFTAGPFLVQLASSSLRRQESRAPLAGVRYGASFDLVEQLT